ncbi:MAG: NAD(P)-dependent oxidoreductase [Acidobacteriota bacterium]
MNAFVTGGTGFIGSHLIDLLLKNNFKVYALIRNIKNPKWLKNKNIEFVEGNLFHIPSMPKDIDYIFHVAGITKETKKNDFMRINFMGTKSFLEIIEKNNISPKKFIHVSTLSSAGPSLDGTPKREDDVPQPVSKYGLSKFMAENQVILYKEKFPVVIVRPPAIFGPRDKDTYIFFKMVNKGFLPYIGWGRKFYSFCYISDLVNGIFLSAEKYVKSGEIINIAHTESFSLDEFLNILVKYLNPTKTIKLKFPTPFVYIAASISTFLNNFKKSPSIFTLDKFKEMRYPYWTCDTKKAEKILSFQAENDLEKSVQNTVQWYKENSWL